MQCVSCNQPLAPGTDFCPRCGADNCSWQQIRLSNGLQQMVDFVRQVPWIQIVAVIILLAALAMAVVALFNTKNTIYWLAGAILLPVISTTLAYGAYSSRWKIREYEWLRKARKKWRPPTLLIAVGLFTLALLLILLLPFLIPTSKAFPPLTAISATQTPFPTPTAMPLPTRTPFPGPTPDQLPINGLGITPGLLNLDPPNPNRPWLPMFLVVIVALGVLGISLIADLEFARQVNRILPRPLCADRARMAQVIRREAEIILDAGRKDREWIANMTRRQNTQSPDGSVVIGDKWSQSYQRRVPPENLAHGIWDRDSSREEVITSRKSQAESNSGKVTQSWQVTERRPGIEVQIQQMWRTDDGGSRVRLAVLTGESEKQMKEGDKLVHLRLQEAHHYELLADEWGWPLELRDIDDYRLVQILRKDIPIIEPPAPLALPKAGD